MACWKQTFSLSLSAVLISFWMIKHHQNVKDWNDTLVIFNVLLYLLVNLLYCTQSEENPLASELFPLHEAFVSERCYLMSTGTKICAGRQIIAHPWYNQHCILDVGNLECASSWLVQLYTSLCGAPRVSDTVCLLATPGTRLNLAGISPRFGYFLSLLFIDCLQFP